MGRLTKCCRECGAELAPLGLRPNASFCCTAHRKEWNNRRAVRGAELYDLLMANRYERDVAKQRGVWTIATNLTRAYRDSDVALRQGRKSWDLNEALDRMPIAYGTDGDKR